MEFLLDLFFFLLLALSEWSESPPSLFSRSDEWHGEPLLSLFVSVSLGLINGESLLLLPVFLSREFFFFLSAFASPWCSVKWVKYVLVLLPLSLDNEVFLLVLPLCFVFFLCALGSLSLESLSPLLSLELLDRDEDVPLLFESLLNWYFPPLPLLTCNECAEGGHVRISAKCSVSIQSCFGLLSSISGNLNKKHKDIYVWYHYPTMHHKFYFVGFYSFIYLYTHSQQTRIVYLLF